MFAGNNNFKTWKHEWFSNTTSIEILDFQHNQIRRLPQQAFSSFRKLKEIHFEHNLLEAIEREAFGGAEHLELVGLNHNNLKEINQNIFSRSVQIDLLRLNQNELSFIPDKVMKKLKIKKINIHYNPWNCMCLERIYQWIRTIKGTLEKTIGCFDETIPECAVSKAHPQKCEEYIEEELTERYLKALKSIPGYPEGCEK